MILARNGWRYLCVLVLCAVVLTAAASTAMAQKVALVIGNGSYQNAPALRNPTNDAADVAAALGDVGFEVQTLTDLTQGAMLDALRTFQRTANGAEIAVIYYAGHGLEIDRTNYLIPVDAVLENDTDVNFEAVPLRSLILSASGARRLSFLIVDACRDNPFATTMQRAGATRSIGRGLAAVEPSERNTLVAYAAKEGSTAADGAGRNSPYASALVAALQEPGLEVGLMMRRVRDAVMEATNGRQEPFVYGSLSAEAIYLNADRGLVPVEAPQPDATTPSSAVPAEVLYWRLIDDSLDPAEFETYLLIYPDGVFADRARARLEELRRSASLTTPEAEAAPQADLRQSTQVPLRALERGEVVELQERLSAGGYDTGPADGIPGARTAAAIRSFEGDRNLPVQGEASLPVLQALRDAVDDEALGAWRQRLAAEAAAARAAERERAAARAARQRQSEPTRPRTQQAQQQPSGSSVEAVVSPKASSDQFCRSQKLTCESISCQGGNRGFNRSCSFCDIYDARCK